MIRVLGQGLGSLCCTLVLCACGGEAVDEATSTEATAVAAAPAITENAPPEQLAPLEQPTLYADGTPILPALSLDEAITEEQASTALQARLAAELEKAGGWESWVGASQAIHERLQQLYGTAAATEDVFSGLFPLQAGVVASDEHLSGTSREAFDTLCAVEHREHPVQAIAALSNWFEDRGVDFIYVPIPTDIEMLGGTAGVGEDGQRLAATHYMLKQLADAGVEVVDLWPAFDRSRQELPGAKLYLANDLHHSDYATRLEAREIARHLLRYDVVQENIGRFDDFVVETVTTNELGKYQSALREKYPDRNLSIETVHTRRVLLPDGGLFTGESPSPVTLAGDSFAYYFLVTHGLNGGVAAHLSRFIGTPVRSVTTSGMMPSEFSPRMNEILSDETEVVVYVQDSRRLARCNGYGPPALPD